MSINPDVTQREKREVLRNDERVRKATYHSFAQADADTEMGGRYAKVQPTTVTGSAPTAWPKMPEGNPWATNPYPPEPLIDGRGEGNRLGYEIDKGPGSTMAAVEEPPSPPEQEISRVTPLQTDGGGRPNRFFRRF